MRKRSEYNKIALLAGRKLNSIEKAISIVLTLKLVTKIYH